MIHGKYPRNGTINTKIVTLNKNVRWIATNGMGASISYSLDLRTVKKIMRLNISETFTSDLVKTCKTCMLLLTLPNTLS